jgi:hypothetical protein
LQDPNQTDKREQHSGYRSNPTHYEPPVVSSVLCSLLRLGVTTVQGRHALARRLVRPGLLEPTVTGREC